MTRESIQSQWRALTKLFPGWTMVFDFFFNPSTYHFWGSDLIQSMQADWRVRRAAAVLAGAPGNLEALTEIAQVNVARTNDAFKAVAVIYVSLPLGLAALFSDAAPDWLSDLLTQHLNIVLPTVIALSAAPLQYFAAHWRAKQIAWTIELFRAGALAPLAK